MVKFSDRIGITQPPTELQVNSMSTELRNSLWNLVAQTFERHMCWLLRNLFIHYFKEPIDAVPRYEHQCTKFLREGFMGCEWYEVYNLIEHILENIDTITDEAEKKMRFILKLDLVLRRELSGYRIIKGKLIPITDEQEIQTIREATSTSSSLGLNGVNQHITRDKGQACKHAYASVYFTIASDVAWGFPGCPTHTHICKPDPRYHKLIWPSGGL